MYTVYTVYTVCTVYPTFVLFVKNKNIKKNKNGYFSALEVLSSYPDLTTIYILFYALFLPFIAGLVNMGMSTIKSSTKQKNLCCQCFSLISKKKIFKIWYCYIFIIVTL